MAHAYSGDARRLEDAGGGYSVGRHAGGPRHLPPLGSASWRLHRFASARARLLRYFLDQQYARSREFSARGAISTQRRFYWQAIVRRERRDACRRVYRPVLRAYLLARRGARRGVRGARGAGRKIEDQVAAL